jgi:hypothetical protein
MWYLVIALLTGTGDYESMVYEMPNYAECRLQKVGVQALDPKGEKYGVSCEFVK